MLDQDQKETFSLSVLLHSLYLQGEDLSQPWSLARGSPIRKIYFALSPEHCVLSYLP